MNEVLENTLWGVFTLGVILSVVFLFLVRGSNTPRWLDVSTGLILISTSGLFISLLTDLQSLLVTSEDCKKVDNQLFNRYEIAMLILPFVSAGIGTNLISHAMTYNHDYKNVLDVKTSFKNVFSITVRIFCALFSIPLILWWMYEFSSAPERRGGARA